MSTSMLTTDGGRTDAGLGDIEMAELDGDGSAAESIPPPLSRKFPRLPSKLVHETRRDVLLGADGDGTGPSASTIICSLLLLELDPPESCCC